MVHYFHFQQLRVCGLLEVESVISHDSEVEISDVVVYCLKHWYVNYCSILDKRNF